MINVSKELENEILILYKQTKNMHEVRRKLNIGFRKIKKVLDDNNIYRKGGTQNNCLGKEDEIIKKYLSGISKHKLREEYKTNEKTINNILESNNIKIRTHLESKQNKNLKHDFFSDIDTEAKAYILGLAFADGSISPERRIKTSYVFQISFKEEDKYLLDYIKENLCYDGNLYYVPSKEKIIRNKKVYSSGQYMLHIPSKQLVNDLEKLGMSKKDKFPNIREDLISHFIRGVFDGDGCISISKRGDIEIFIMGTENFLNETNKYINFNKPKFTRGIYKSRKSGRLNAIKFANYIYENANIYMKRKYNKFAVLSQKLQKTQDY